MSEAAKGMEGLYAALDRQSEVIRLQNEAIRELYGLLIQHISVEEAASLPCLGRLSEAGGEQGEGRQPKWTS